MIGVATLPVHSPYSGELVGEAPLADLARTRAMLDAGASYVDELPRHERSRILFAVADALTGRLPELAELISAESGLCLKDTRHEVARAVDVFRFAAIEALRDDGETFAGDISPHGRDRRAHTLRVPVRLVAAITPFNHPLNQVAHKLAPAIAAGAPIVLKPSEKTPLSAFALVELIRDRRAARAGGAGRLRRPRRDPRGVPRPRGGRGHFLHGRRCRGQVRSPPASAIRRAVLELGGNDPLIVLDDADLQEAAELAVRGAFQNSGQRCTAVKRIIAVEAIADALAARVTESAAALRAGDPMDESTDVGTVIDEAAARTIEGRVRAAVAAGSELLYGGERDGALLTPAVLDHVPADVELVARETFGPVAPIIRVADLDGAIAAANSTPYALSSGVCTFDWRAIARCIREVRAGTVNVREVPGWRTELTPFGGVGDSGLGVKEGVREAIRAMSFTKLYTLPWS